MKKLLFIDLDGTLLQDNEVITERNAQMMAAFQQAGHDIIICTGRNRFETKQAIIKGHFPYNYLIMNNGGQILNDQDEECFALTIAKETGLEILQMMLDDGEMVSCFCDRDGTYNEIKGELYDHREMADVKIEGDFMTLARASEGFDIVCFNQIDQKFDRAQKLLDHIEVHYGDEVTCHRNAYFVDVVPQGCSKASGVEVVQSLYSQAIKTYTIGDSYNDLPMILCGDVGCTFTYANKEIQSQADRIYDYVYELIEDILGGII